MENNQKIESLQYQIEQLQKEKRELQKQACKDKIKETTKLIYSENEKDPLNERELENLLRDFYYDIKNILES